MVPLGKFGFPFIIIVALCLQERIDTLTRYRNSSEDYSSPPVPIWVLNSFSFSWI